MKPWRRQGEAWIALLHCFQPCSHHESLRHYKHDASLSPAPPHGRGHAVFVGVRRGCLDIVGRGSFSSVAVRSCWSSVMMAQTRPRLPLGRRACREDEEWRRTCGRATCLKPWRAIRRRVAVDVVAKCGSGSGSWCCDGEAAVVRKGGSVLLRHPQPIAAMILSTAELIGRVSRPLLRRDYCMW